MIGLAGSNEKCDYIRDLGFDHAINYKTEDISKALDLVAPSGVDIYFDNVRETTQIIIFFYFIVGRKKQPWRSLSPLENYTFFKIGTSKL